MGSLSRRFNALIAWAESQGTQDGQLAALVLQGIWADLEGTLRKEILEFEEEPIVAEVV
jgi:hypothetical protein